MPHVYVHRARLRDALALPATALSVNPLLDVVAEQVSRNIDRWTGHWFYPRTAAFDFTALQGSRLLLPDLSLLSISALRTDTSGATDYGTTLSATCYDLAPYNATLLSPPQPYWQVLIRPNSSAVLPAGVARGVRILGSWGYYDERETSSATFATAINASQTTIEAAGATGIYPGQTVLAGSEQMFVREWATGAGTTVLTVDRGANGTTATTHSSVDSLQVYRYPVIEHAALFQSQMDWRGREGPLGAAGGGEFGQQVIPAPGGLHPFVRRLLEPFRTPGGV